MFLKQDSVLFVLCYNTIDAVIFNVLGEAFCSNSRDEVINLGKKSASLAIQFREVSSGHHDVISFSFLPWNFSETLRIHDLRYPRRDCAAKWDSWGPASIAGSRVYKWDMSTLRLHFPHWLHFVSETTRLPKSVLSLDCEYPGKSRYVYIMWTISSY